MQWSPGDTAQLTATFMLSTGALVDPEDLRVNIFDPEGDHIVINGVATRVSEGFYLYEHEIAEGADLGLWRVEWEGTVEERPIFGSEVFQIAHPDAAVIPSDQIMHFRLRSRLAETKSAPETDGSETMFDDAAIADLIIYSGGDLDAATLEGWKRKAARLSRLVDVSESGSDRKMSQKFKQAQGMVKFWQDFIGGSEKDRQMALAGRVVGRAVNLREDLGTPNLWPSRGYAQHVRLFPTHRLLIPALWN